MIADSRNSRDSYYSSLFDDYASSSSRPGSPVNAPPTRLIGVSASHKRRPSLNINLNRESVSSLRRQPSYDFPSPSTPYFSSNDLPRITSPLSPFNIRDSISQASPSSPKYHFYNNREDKRDNLGTSSIDSGGNNVHSRRNRIESIDIHEPRMNSLTIPRGQENQLSSSLSGSSIGEENNIGEDNCRDFNRPSSTSSYDDDLDSIRNKDKFAQSSSTLRNSRLNGKTQLDSDRDQYGFKKSYQWVTRKEHADFESTYTHIQQRRKIKWDSLLAENGGNLPTKSSKVKRYIRKGIPPFLRGCVWFHYSGAANKMKDQPDLYEKLLQKSEDPRIVNEYVEVIERDLHRTFPENIKFKSTVVSEDGGSTLMTDNVPIIQSLRRVLVAFSLYSPNIGYCQSLNYIAGLLLLFMEEEQAFWTIVAIIHEYLPENMYDVTMEGSNVDQAVLMRLVIDKMPHLWNKLSAGFGWDVDKLDLNMPTITLVTSHWFLTLYINILPTETMLRVWDCFFYEGHKVLFRVALAIFKINEDKILAVTDDPMEVFQIVQNMPKRLIDCHKLMEVCFRRRKAVSHIQRKEIERLREHFRERRKQRVGTILTNKY